MKTAITFILLPAGAFPIIWLREGMTGTLTWKGPYFVGFDKENGL